MTNFPFQTIAKTCPRGWAKMFVTVVSAALICLPARGAELVKLDSLKDGTRTYENVVVLGTSDTDLYFKHSQGIANVKLKYLEPEVQKQFGYDPKLAEAAEKRQLQEDAAYQKVVATEVTARAKKALQEVKTEAAPPIENLIDPISDQSLLNKPAPKLEVEKWLGKPPTTKDKPVLVLFWATWSAPCLKVIPDLNDYQKKFGDKLVIVGLSAQPSKELTNLAGLKIDFPLATDTKSQLATAAGVTSVPCVLLTDAGGVVRYLGHPAALNADGLTKIVNP